MGLLDSGLIGSGIMGLRVYGEISVWDYGIMRIPVYGIMGYADRGLWDYGLAGRNGDMGLRDYGATGRRVIPVFTPQMTTPPRPYPWAPWPPWIGTPRGRGWHREDPGGTWPYGRTAGWWRVAR